jgi:predicted RNase H-like HicB family nuclease
MSDDSDLMRHVVAIAEPADDGTWLISFPGLPGVTSAADGPGQIAEQARDALASAVEAGSPLPPAVEDGGMTPFDPADYHDPLVVLVSYAAPCEVAPKSDAAPLEQVARDEMVAGVGRGFGEMHEQLARQDKRLDAIDAGLAALRTEVHDNTAYLCGYILQMRHR